MSTTRKKAPGKVQPAAALRTKPAPAKSAADIKGQPKPIQFGSAPLLPPAITLTMDPELRAALARLDYATGIATLGATSVGAAPSICGAASLPQGMPVVGPGELGSFASSDAMAAPPTRPYVLLYRDNLIALIGPFGTTDEAAAWSQSLTNNPYEDPRWQVLNLSFDATHPRRFTPWEASLAIQAGNL